MTVISSVATSTTVLGVKNKRKLKLIKPVTVYLAGPGVFLRNPIEYANKLKEICKKYSLVGKFPLDNVLDLTSLSLEEMKFAISRANEKMIRKCKIIIACLTPFRGSSADAGTVYEVGAGIALKKKVYGYSNTTESFFDRVVKNIKKMKGQIAKRPDGLFEDQEGMMLENICGLDNLMISAGILDSGGKIVTKKIPRKERYTSLEAFEEIVKIASEDHKNITKYYGKTFNLKGGERLRRKERMK